MSVTVGQVIVGVIVIGGAVAYALIQLIRGGNPTPPDWLSLSVGAIIGYFFANNSALIQSGINQRTASSTADVVKKAINGNG